MPMGVRCKTIGRPYCGHSCRPKRRRSLDGSGLIRHRQAVVRSKGMPLTFLLFGMAAWPTAKRNQTRKERVLRPQHTTQRRSLKIVAFTGALSFVIATGLEVGPSLGRPNPQETDVRHQGKTGARHH